MGVIAFDEQDVPEWAREAGNRQRLLTWVEGKYPGPPGLRCAGCGKDEWTVGGLIGTPILSAPGATTGRQLLLVPLECRHCACVLTLNAETLGLTF